MTLTPEDYERYGRQIILPSFGPEGQEKLKAARVLLVGAGGLGSPSAIYLAAAGVGTLGIIDPDTVELKNLHRQVLHAPADIGRKKVDSARDKIQSLNPAVRVQTYAERLCATNALNIFKDYDLIIDGTDNFPARYLINDAAVFLNKPFVYGGILRFEGQCSVFGWEDGPCYRCLFDTPPSPGEVPSCAEAGVIGVLPGIIGLLQSNEAVKILCGLGEPLKGRLLIFEALETRFREVSFPRNPNCPRCSPEHRRDPLKDLPWACEETQEKKPSSASIPTISVEELKTKMEENPLSLCLLDVREPEEWAMGHIPGARHKPLSRLKDDQADIPRDQPVYVYCKLGGRSRRAIELLNSKGFDNLINIEGGIKAWRDRVDPTLPDY